MADFIFILRPCQRDNGYSLCLSLRCKATPTSGPTPRSVFPGGQPSMYCSKWTRLKFIERALELAFGRLLYGDKLRTNTHTHTHTHTHRTRLACI